MRAKSAESRVVPGGIRSPLASEPVLDVADEQRWCCERHRREFLKQRDMNGMSAEAVGDATDGGPESNAVTPLQFVFRIDASRIASGEDETTISVFKNGSLVANRTAAGAVPDPCIGVRALLGDGHVQFTIRTSTASLWNFAIGSFCDPSPDLSCAGRRYRKRPSCC
jgi:hypothetical protein